MDDLGAAPDSPRPYDRQTLTTSAETAAVAALARRNATGAVCIEVVTPLLMDGAPAFTHISHPPSPKAKFPEHS